MSYHTVIRLTGETEIAQGSDGSAMLSIPIRIKRRGERKQVIPPGGQPRQRVEITPIQQALLRGYRWLAMLESGAVTSIREIERIEGVDNSYISRMINLTMLSPVLIQAILEDTLGESVTLMALSVEPPLVWGANEMRLSDSESPAIK